MTKKKSDANAPDQNKPTTKARKPRRNRLIALEPRMLFEGEAIADVRAPDRPVDLPRAPLPIDVPEANEPVATPAIHDPRSEVQRPATPTDSDRDAAADEAAGRSGFNVQVAGLDRLPPEARDALRGALQLVEQQLQNFVESPAFRTAMSDIFDASRGEQDFDAAIEALAARIQAGQLGLTLQIVPGEALGQHAGAYAAVGADGAERIYINAEWLREGADVREISGVVLEELGHALDQRINLGVDSAGDEGQLFANTVTNQSLTADAVAALRSEDDGGTVRIGDDLIAVEFASNDPPTSTSQTIAAFGEDTTPNTLAVPAIPFADINAGETYKGVMITGNSATAAQGVWQYSTDNGANWTAIGTVSTSSGRYLANSAGTLIRFSPTANYSGSVGTLSYYVLSSSDTVSRTNGSLSSLPSSGSKDRSASAYTITQSAILSVNDAPTLSATSSNPTFTEGGTAIAIFSGAAAGTVETGQTITSLTFTVAGVQDGANERITFDGTTVGLGANSAATTATNAMTYSVTLSGRTATVTLTKAAGITTSAAATLVNGIRYQHIDVNAPTSGSRVFTLTQIQDSGGTSNAGQDTSNYALTSTVSVVAVNDAPTFTGTAGGVTFTENASAVAIMASAAIADVDVANLNGTQLTVAFATYQAGDVLTINNQGSGAGQVGYNSSTGVVSYGGVAIGTATGGNGSALVITFNSASATTAAVNAVANQLRYSSTSDDPTAGGTATTRALTVTFNDCGNSGTGGPLTAARTGTVTVAAVNDAPTVTFPTSVNTNVNTSYTFAGGVISVADVDASTLQVTLTATNGTMSLNGTGGLTFSAGDGTADATMTFSGTKANINAALNGLVYAPTNGYAGSATITVSASDLGSTGTGGTLIDTEVIGITVSSPNNPPVNTVPGAQTITEDTAQAISGLSVADTNGNLSSTQLTVVNGRLNVSLAGGASISAGANNSGTLTLSGTQAQINAALATLAYQGNANFYGSDTLTVVSRDSSNATDTDTVAITVTNVNDAGSVTVAGTAMSGQSLTASVTDADGLGSIAYQWQRSWDNGATWQNIGGATAASYLATSADVGAKVRATATYTDLTGTLETVLSADSRVMQSYSLTSSNTDLSILQLGTRFDYITDTQSNAKDTDLVGDATNPLLLGGYDNASDTMYFRVRIGNPTMVKEGTTYVPRFTGMVFLGVDVNGDGKLDLMIGVDGRNSGLGVVMYDPGTGTNDSPSTTSITNQTAAYSLTSGQRAVTYDTANLASGDTAGTYQYKLINSGATDIGTTGGTDAYLTFKVPLSAIQTRLNTVGGGRSTPLTYNESDPIRFALFTATQNNSINGDVGGIGASKADYLTKWSDIVQTVSLTNPSLSGISGSITYAENYGATSLAAGLPKALASTADFSDLDNAIYGGGALTVSIVNGTYQTGDSLTVMSGVNGIAVTGTDIYISGNKIGSYTWNAVAGQLTVNFTGANATPDAVKAVMRSVGYASDSNAPVTTTRTVSFALTDPDGRSSTSATSPAPTVSVIVEAINDAPTIAQTGNLNRTVDNSVAYGAGDGAARILTAGVASGLSVTDVDAASSQIQVRLAVDKGVLDLYNSTTLLSGATTNTFSWGANSVSITGAGTSTLVLSGTQSAINAFLAGGSAAQIVYQPGSLPGTATQTANLSMTVSDLGNVGTGGVLTASQNVGVITITGQPLLLGTFKGTVFEDSSPTSLVASSSVGSVSGSLTGATITYQGNSLGTANLGALTVAANGTWTYTVSNTATAV